MIAKLFSFLTLSGYYGIQKSREEAWLSKSVDLADLERRQRALERGDVTLW